MRDKLGDGTRIYPRKPWLGLWAISCAIGLLLLALPLSRYILGGDTFNEHLSNAVLAGIVVTILFNILVLFGIAHGIIMIVYAKKTEHIGIGVFSLGIGSLILA